MLLQQDENKECVCLRGKQKGRERQIQRGRESKSVREREGERFWISCYVTFSCEKQKLR